MYGQGNVAYNGPIPSLSSLGLTATLQYEWVVGGASNFATLPGPPVQPVAGANLVDAGLIGKQVRVSRNGLWQSGYNPGNGNSYYTKVLASNTVVFVPAIANTEEMIVETIPV